MNAYLDLDETLPAGCLSDLAIDRLLAGELGDDSEAALHLVACGACAARRDAIRADAEVFHAERIAATPRLKVVRGGATDGRDRSRWVRRAAPVLALAASVAVVAVMLPSRSPPPAEGFATKGGGPLALIARTAEGKVDRILPGDPLAPGDAVRFEVKAAETSRVWILGLDAAGAVTVYVDDAAVQGGLARVLPGSVVLDGTLGVERIVALFCRSRLEKAAVIAAGRSALTQAGGDPAGEISVDLDGCTQSSILVRKTRR